MERSLAQLRALDAKLPQPMKFAAVGAFNVGLNAAIFLGLVYVFAVEPVPASVAAYGTAIVSSYLLNRYWTFAGSSGALSWRQFGVYAGFNLAALGIYSVVIWLLADTITPVGAMIVGLTATYVWNYSTSRFVVFRPAA